MAGVKRIDASGGWGVLNPEKEVMITSPYQNVPREKVLGVGIIGLGAIAQRSHIPNFQEARGAKVIAVCDVNKQKAELVAHAWGIKKWYTDYRELLNDEEVDVVSICTPHYLHEPMTIAACEAGKHVLCEKPLATTVEAGKKMIEAARRNNVKLGVAQFKKFLPAYEIAKDIIEENIIGSPLMFRSKLSHEGPESWSPVTGEWFFERDKAGIGVLTDLGIKHISLLRWLFNAEVEWVMGKLANLEKKPEIEDYAVAIMGFENKVVGVLEASWCTRPGFKGTEIVGTRGTLFVDYPNTKLEVRLGSKVNAVITPEVPQESRKGNPFQRFIDCILFDKEPDVTAEDELRSLEVAFAIAKSSETGQLIRLPSAERRCGNNVR